MASRKLEILKRLTAVLETISPENGYAFDMKGRVYRGRSTYGDETPVPYLSLIERPRPDDGVAVGEHMLVRNEDWVLLLQGYVEDDKQNPTDPAYELMAEVEACLSCIVEIDRESGEGKYPQTYLLGGMVAEMEILPGVVSPPRQNISANSFFYMPLRIQVVSDPSRPFV